MKTLHDLVADKLERELTLLREHYHRTPLGEREAVAVGRNLGALLGEGGGR